MRATVLALEEARSVSKLIVCLRRTVEEPAAYCSGVLSVWDAGTASRVQGPRRPPLRHWRGWDQRTGTGGACGWAAQADC